MPPPRIPRRAVLALFGGLPLSGCIVGGNPPLPFEAVRAIDLDVTPLATRGLPNWAERVEAALRPALARLFADALAPNDPKAPRIRIVIDHVWCAPSPSGDDDGPFRTDAEDEMAGRVETPAWAGLPALTRSIRASRSPADAGPWYLPDIDDRRLAALAEKFAAFARREIAG